MEGKTLAKVNRSWGLITSFSRSSIFVIYWLNKSLNEFYYYPPQARLWPSELVTIRLLFALKGGYFRAFCRWLQRDHDDLFGGSPERTRLRRGLGTHQGWGDRFLATLHHFHGD